MNCLKASLCKFPLWLTSKDEASVKVKDTTIKDNSSKKLPGNLVEYKL